MSNQQNDIFYEHQQEMKEEENTMLSFIIWVVGIFIIIHICAFLLEL